MIGMEVNYPAQVATDCFFMTRESKFTSLEHTSVVQTVPSRAWIQSFDPAEGGVYTLWDQYPRVAHSLFGVILTTQKPTSILPIMALSSGVLNELRGANGLLEARVSVRTNPVLAQGFLAQEPGATQIRGGYRLSIESIRFASGDTMKVGFRVTSVERRDNYANPVFALVNPQAGEVSLAESGRENWSYARSDLLSDERSSCVFAHRWQIRSAAVTAGIGAEWLKHAELRYFMIGYKLDRTIELSVPQFEMPKVGGIQ